MKDDMMVDIIMLIKETASLFKKKFPEEPLITDGCEKIHVACNELFAQAYEMAELYLWKYRDVIFKADWGEIMKLDYSEELKGKDATVVKTFTRVRELLPTLSTYEKDAVINNLRQCVALLAKIKKMKK